MNGLIKLALAGVVVMSLTACGGDNTPNTPKEPNPAPSTEVQPATSQDSSTEQSAPAVEQSAPTSETSPSTSDEQSQPVQ